MKKKWLVLVLTLSVIPTVCFADWTVTVNWTASKDPNLKNEVVNVGGDPKCTVAKGETASCTFVLNTVIAALPVLILSVNTQGAYSEYEAGEIFPIPAPASGGVIVVTFNK